ncbi:uncharacterized protein IL334_002251 [Kwoniella shivajii]|uniref:HpcH/HpaI aldolase/citrate lyase domain-containing protein n=1 Tax=Kwoniella shivajii TaxID=564305 RepID=A0ABZ1CUU0_9TREE|nr:hypothetical protein IL334_002251 [Kwoniella shivajii]
MSRHSFGSPPAFGDANFAAVFGVPSAPEQDPSMLNYRGYALHQAFDLRSRMAISREKPLVGMFYGAFPHPSVARMIGQAGFDYVILDWEHTPYKLIKVIQYAGEGRTAVVVRIPGHDHHFAAWDAGASGVIFPHIQNVEQAKAAISACRFPPVGNRSGPPNAMQFGYNDGAAGGGGVFEVWNRAAIILQIEDEEGADNADAIAALEEVDGLMLGPGDLAFSLGLTFAEIGKDEKWLSCASKVATAAENHSLAYLMPGMGSAQVGLHLQSGVTMTCAANDSMIMAIGLRKELISAHEQLAVWKTSKH